ncbi:hypothetical protein, variant [Puccinia striiformis f. sp. tritici PST-78]|uniref:Uncharacterized protein n=1 Tax=Puccinia striiformis f. sp. tritici PST-78 TaxID=1165861 RepID=A0A0L0UWC1_9BASI|nr:hypothetical protein, variant [Puccinia striiformis f. sp. tritici PST-78]
MAKSNIDRECTWDSPIVVPSAGEEMQMAMVPGEARPASPPYIPYTEVDRAAEDESNPRRDPTGTPRGSGAGNGAAESSQFPGPPIVAELLVEGPRRFGAHTTHHQRTLTLGVWLDSGGLAELIPTPRVAFTIMERIGGTDCTDPVFQRPARCQEFLNDHHGQNQVTNSFVRGRTGFNDLVGPPPPPEASIGGSINSMWSAFVAGVHRDIAIYSNGFKILHHV